MHRLIVAVASAATVVLVMMADGGQSRAMTDGDVAAATPEAGCMGASRTYDELVALVGISAPGDPAPERAAPTAIPAGDPVDVATRDQIVAAAKRLIACGNTGDSLRLLALYSDRLLRSMGPLPASTLAALATPEPDGPRAALVDVRDIVRLSDGRVSAILLISWHPDDARPDASVAIFVQDDGEWLLDETYRDIAVGDEIVSIEDAIGTPVSR